jgi:predicted MFS family arabinose efflux permease
MNYRTTSSVAHPGSMRMLGEFASADSLIACVQVLVYAGHNQLETFTPFDMPELDAWLGLRRSRIGWLVLVCGVAGMIMAYGIQWWANVHNYPLNSGGRPANAVPAFLFPTFEGTVLLAAFGAFFGLMCWLRLPKLWAPIDEIPGFGRASVDRFWIAVGGIDGEVRGSSVERLMRDAGAVNTFGPVDA